MWYRFLKFWVRVTFAVFFRIRVFGRENVPLEGPVVLASNHQSFLDPLLVGAGLRRQVHYMARKGLFGQFGPFDRLIRSLNAFPVARDRGDIGAIRETIRRLGENAAVLVFPEGTRTYEGEVRPFKPGIFMVAARSGAPVIPTVVEGAFESWPRFARFPRPSTIWVCFGKRLDPADFAGDAKRMGEACRRSVTAMKAVLQSRRRRLVRCNSR